MKLKVGRHQHLMKALISVVCLSATGVPALAQSPQALEEVLITGSSIKRVQAEGPLPVQTFTQQDIERSGVTSVTDFIQQLPAMQGFTSLAQSVGGGGGGITTASLHDVGEQYTLVLLNGRRIAPANSGTTIDLNAIPLSAIERVEVLTDGASAVYGADAIAGVVNFILKQGYQPLTMDARVKVLEYGGGQQQNFAISQGWGGLQSKGYGLFLSASLDKTNRLKSTDREFAKTGLISGQYGDLIYSLPDSAYGIGLSSRSIPPNVTVYSSGAPVSFSPYYKLNSKCPTGHVLVGSQCKFDYTSSVEIAPELERAAIFGSGKLKLGDSGWNLFGELAYADVKTTTRIAPFPGEFNLPYDTAPTSLYSKYVKPYIPSGNDFETCQATDPNCFVLVKYRLYELGNRTNEYANNSLHLVAGIEGSLSAWDLSGTATLSTQTVKDNYLAGYPLEAAFTAALTSGAIDPFQYPLGTMPASQVAALRGTQFIGTFSTDKINMLGLSGNAQRAMFNLPGGDLIASFGADFRKTGYKSTPSSVAAAGQILFDEPMTAFDLSRDNLGAYAEVLAPLINKLDLAGAVRLDSISGVKDKASGVTSGKTESAATYKVGAKYQALDTLLLRASYGTGFRTASMRQIAQPQVNFGVTGGAYACPLPAIAASNPSDPLLTPGYICDDGQFEVLQVSNSSLKPEKSKQWNVGLVWEPLDAVSVGLNYWSVEITDAISSISEEQIFDDPVRYRSLLGVKHKPTGSNYIAMLDKPINLGATQNQGLDWDLSFKKDLGIAKLTTRVSGTYLDVSRYTTPLSDTEYEWTSSLGKYGANGSVSFPNVITASATIEYGSWEHTLSMKSRDGYKDIQYSYDECVFYDPNADDCVAAGLDVPSYTTYDWSTKWLFEKNTSLTFAVENLFNEEPPRSLQTSASHAMGYDPRYASPYMRGFSLALQKKF
jgi:iron complex outermembrane receptor protein